MPARNYDLDMELEMNQGTEIEISGHASEAVGFSSALPETKPVTRSGRVIKKTSYLKEYHCSAK